MFDFAMFDPAYGPRSPGPRGTAQIPRTGSRPWHEQPWHERRNWRRYAEGLLRYYTGRRTYTLHVHGLHVEQGRDVTPLAAVTPAVRRVLVACRFPRIPEDLPIRGAEIRGAEDARERPTAFWLRTLIAHEAAHVLWTGALPEETCLARLVNILEDERIERLQGTRHARLSKDFDTIGDVMLARHVEGEVVGEKVPSEGPDSLAATVLKACLLHRWSHDVDWFDDCPLPSDDWDVVCPLVEEAWVAASYADVVSAAAEILAHFGIDEEELPDEIDDLPILGGWIDVPAGAQPGPTGAQPDTCGGGGATSDEAERADDPGVLAPEAPDLDPHGADARRVKELTDGLDPVAERMAQVLLPRMPSPLPAFSKSRGRFEFRRHALGYDDAYRRLPETNTRRVTVDVLLDASSSMLEDEGNGSRFFHAQRTVLAIALACERAGNVGGDGSAGGSGGVPIRVIPFTERPLDILSAPTPDLSNEALRHRVARLEPDGSTALAPALRLALGTGPARANSAPATGAPANGYERIVIVVTDGELDEQDAADAGRMVRQAKPRPILIPILIGRGEGRAAEYRRVFRRCASIEELSDLPRTVGRCIRDAMR